MVPSVYEKVLLEFILEVFLRNVQWLRIFAGLYHMLHACKLILHLHTVCDYSDVMRIANNFSIFCVTVNVKIFEIFIVADIMHE